MGKACFRVESRWGDDARPVPSHFFWYSVQPIPGGMDPGEVTEAAGFTIQAKSPYPEDRTLGGAIYLETTGVLVSFAASAGRLRQAGHVVEPQASWMGPGFLAALVVADRTEGDVLIEAADGSFAIGRDEGGLRIAVFPPEWPESARAELRRTEGFGRPPSGDEETFRLIDVRFGRQGMEIGLREGPDAPEGEPLATGLDVSSSDIRGAATVAALRKAERVRKRLRWSLRGIAAALALLVVGELGLLLLGSSAESRTQRLEGLDQARLQMETRRELVLRLEALANGSPRLLDVLGFANQRRPGEVEWSRAEVEAIGRAVIEGNAPTIRDVNVFADRLREAQALTSVEQDSTVREGRIRFDLVLTFPPDFRPEGLQ